MGKAIQKGFSAKRFRSTNSYPNPDSLRVSPKSHGAGHFRRRCCSFARRKEVREAQANQYIDFVDEYELAADRLIQAAHQGHQLDPSRHFPKGSFPRPGPSPSWGATSTTHPRRLDSAADLQGADDPRIVWREEISTAHIPRSDLDGIPAPGNPAVSPEPPTQPSGCLARDPPCS